MSDDFSADSGASERLEEAPLACAGVSLEQVHLHEAAEQIQEGEENKRNEGNRRGEGDNQVPGEVFEQLQQDLDISAVSTVDGGYDSVATSIQSLDISSDGTESAPEHLAVSGEQRKQPQQEEWICLSTPDGYWYWLNTVTGVSQWADSTEQEPSINWLHKYAVAGSVEEVQHVLSSEATDVNGTNDQGQTALHLVCGLRYPSQRTLTVAEMLLRFGAHADAQDSGGNTALHACATTNGAPPIISMLLTYGARPYVINAQGHTPLQSAALASNYDAMQVILQFTTKAVVVGKENQRQLPQSTESTGVSRHQPLAHRPEWVRYWTSDGIPYLHDKVSGESKWDIDETSEMEPNSDQNGHDNHTNGQLSPVKPRGNREELDRHLQVWSKFFENAFREHNRFGTPPSSPHALKPVKRTRRHRQLSLWPDLPSDDEYAKAVQLSWQPKAASPVQQSTSMLAAAMMSDVDTVRRFLQAGTPPHVTDEMLRSAAHHAAHLDCVEILVVLQDFGADLDLMDADVNTPLHVASMQGHVGVVIFLLESAVDVNIQNKNGDTALHLAVKQRQLEVCRQLLGYGADQTIRNGTGYTAQDTATLVAPHHQTMFTEALTELFTANQVPRVSNGLGPRTHTEGESGAQSVGKFTRPRKIRSSSDLRLKIPDQEIRGAGRTRPSSVRDSRARLRREPITNSFEENGSSEDSSSTDSNGSSGWTIGGFLYRTTMRLVGMNKETQNKPSGQSADSEAEQSSRRSGPPTDAELAAMRASMPLSSPPAEVMRDIRQKEQEIKRNTPRGREVVYPQVQPPAEVVVTYDMAKAAARASPPNIPSPAPGASNMYSLASVPPAARKSYIDFFEARDNATTRSKVDES